MGWQPFMYFDGRVGYRWDVHFDCDDDDDDGRYGPKGHPHKHKRPKTIRGKVYGCPLVGGHIAPRSRCRECVRWRPTGPAPAHRMVTRRGWRPLFTETKQQRQAARDAYGLFREDWRRQGITSGEYAKRYKLDALRLWTDDAASEDELPLYGDGDGGYRASRTGPDGSDIGRRSGRTVPKYTDNGAEDDGADAALSYTSVRLHGDYGRSRLEWDAADLGSRRLHDIHMLVSIRNLGLAVMVRRTGLKADTLRRRYNAARSRILTDADADVFPELPRGRPRKSGIATVTSEEAGTANPPAPQSSSDDAA